MISFIPLICGKYFSSVFSPNKSAYSKFSNLSLFIAPFETYPGADLSLIGASENEISPYSTSTPFDESEEKLIR